MSLFTRWIEDHQKSCPAMEAVDRGDWNTPWWYPGGIVWRSKTGMNIRGGTTRFLVFECNTLQCSAQVIVRIDDILVQIPNTR